MDVELPRVETSRLQRSQTLWVQGVEGVIQRVGDAPALGARGATAKVGGAGGPLGAVILAGPLHTQEPGDPLQQNQLNLQRGKQGGGRSDRTVPMTTRSLVIKRTEN